MSDNDHAPAVNEPGALDWDAPCASCGYNLRGLYGDPLRCPECGRLNPRPTVEVTEAQVRKELKGLLATANFACWIGLFWFSGLVVVGFNVARGIPDTWTLYDPAPAALTLCVGSVGLVFLMTVWVLTLVAHRFNCRRVPTWARRLVLAHVLTAVRAGCVLGSVFLADVLLSAGGLYVRAGRVVLAAMAPALAIVAWIWLGRVRDRLLAPLLRDEALRLARERITERQSRGRP